jgi:Holliday junction resolvase RusA-like endonuclease
VNHYKTRFRNGNTVVSKEALAFKQEIALAVHGRFETGKTFSVEMEITLGKKQKGDVDNFPKLVLDGLADCGTFHNYKGKIVSDAHVRIMRVLVDDYTRPREGKTDICVEVLR